jgi:hypothetical protein
MLIKNKDIPNIVKALSLMASLGNTQQDGKAKAFSFKNPGKVRYDLARTFKRVQAAEEDLTAFQQSLFAQILAEQNADAAVPATQLNPEHVGKFNAAAAQQMEAEVEIDIRPVAIADLDLDNNDIPFSVIGVLLDTVILDK